MFSIRDDVGMGNIEQERTNFHTYFASNPDSDMEALSRYASYDASIDG